MSHFAQIVDGIVTTVIVAEKDFIDTQKGIWVQTSYNTKHNQHPNNTPLRGNFAGIGYTYNSDEDVFIPPQPFDSWILNKTIWDWEAPVALPDDANEVAYAWDESTQSWKDIETWQQ
jgi:hypothetical protein